MNSFDYVIVGAGSAGCVLANRLSERPDVQVLLIEAGPPDRSPLVAIPKGFGKLLRDPRHAHIYPVKPHQGNGHRPELWLRGKTLGGSSSINGMIYERGFAYDYDLWEQQHGAQGWGWAQMSRAFAQLDGRDESASAAGGARASGIQPRLGLSVHPDATPLTEAVLAAGRRLGLPTLPHVDGQMQEGLAQGGLAYTTSTIRDGLRQSAARTFLSPLRNRPNLRVLTGLRVDRLLFDGLRAVGVLAHSPQGSQRFEARREVILSAGAIESPKLLQLSGIGDAALLQRLGIPVLAHRPAVGGNMLEHWLLMTQWRLKDGQHSLNREYAGWRLAKHALRYLLTRRGLLAQGPFPVGGCFKADPTQAWPDAQFGLGEMSLDYGDMDDEVKMEAFPGFQMFAYPLRPQSQGRLSIVSTDAATPPEIDPGYLSHPHDQQVAMGGLAFLRQLASTQPLANFIAEETRPGPRVRSDEQVLEACRRLGQPTYHTCGTCRMGGDTDSVVDPQLRVRGVEGLRVVDLSIAPTMLSSPTNGPTMAIAWRAAELIA